MVVVVGCWWLMSSALGVAEVDYIGARCGGTKSGSKSGSQGCDWDRTKTGD